MRPEIRELNVRLQRLDRPIARWARSTSTRKGQPPAIIEVFSAKWPGDSWNDPFLRELVGYCRESFKMYDGMTMALESADEEASIFLSRVISEGQEPGQLIHEWFSFRAKSGDENVRDFRINGQRNLEGLTATKDRLLDLSRFCGIPSYSADANGLAVEYVSAQRTQLPMESLVLMTMQFIRDYLELAENAFDFATFIMPEHLLERMFVLDHNGQSIHMPVDPQRDSCSINTMRLAPFEFARYWFNERGLARALRDLCDEGLLTKQALLYYLANADGLADQSNLGRLLAMGGDEIRYPDEHGVTRSCKIHPIQLRIEIVQRVRLASKLHIIPIAVWRAGFERMFRAIGYTKIS